MQRQAQRHQDAPSYIEQKQRPDTRSEERKPERHEGKIQRHRHRQVEQEEQTWSIVGQVKGQGDNGRGKQAKKEQDDDSRRK